MRRTWPVVGCTLHALDDASCHYCASINVTSDGGYKGPFILLLIGTAVQGTLTNRQTPAELAAIRCGISSAGIGH